MTKLEMAAIGLWGLATLGIGIAGILIMGGHGSALYIALIVVSLLIMTFAVVDFRRSKTRIFKSDDRPETNK